MKKILKNFFVSALMVLITVSLVACAGNENDVNINNAPFGNDYPKNIKTKYSINENMNALEMYEAGVKNFNESEFVASRQIGKIVTDTHTFLGKMTQKLDSLKIKQNNKNYLETNTFTIDGSPEVNIVDQSIYENGKYRVRSAKDIKVNKEDNTVEVKKWKDIEHFNTLQEGLNKFPNDPTRVNMYIINKRTVIDSTKPEYDAKSKTYKFQLVLDNEKATKDYIANMKYNSSAGGVKNPQVKFNSLKLTVEMWDNGLIKSIASDETYNVSGKMIIDINSDTALLATTYFTYNNAEINIDNYLKF